MVRSTEVRSRWGKLTRPVQITAIVVIIILVAGVGYWAYTKRYTCGPGVDLIDEQCIGVTDGSVLLSPDLADVLGKIREENKKVDRSGRNAVSVAYLLPLPKPVLNDPFPDYLRHELEGAHLAQRIANGAESQGDEPLLRLLIANDGDRSSQWGKVVSALEDKVDGPERLVAVVATGQTLTTRQQAIGALLAKQIPVIASQLTGDKLTPTTENPSTTQGLARIAPSNSDEAAAAAAYLKPSATRALVVQNTDPEDSYSQSLGTAFQKDFTDDTHKIVKPIETYNPQLGGVANTMRDMLVSICQQKPDIVFFAGRSAELAAFVKALPTRPCIDFPINVMSGDDIAQFATTVIGNHELREGLSTNASVRYTALAHPESWAVSPGGFAPGAMRPFQSSCERCFRTVFPEELPDESLNDGAAIMGHDAIKTIEDVIGTRGETNDRPTLIIQQFNRMHGEKSVPGASGWISIDDHGDVINKAVPILEVQPGGTVVFVQLSAPRGSPCRPEDPALC